MYIANPLLPVRLATTFRGLYLFLLNKWYFDELYDAIFVQPMLRLSRCALADRRCHDHRWRAQRRSPNSPWMARRQAVKIQTGSLAVYAFTMLIGVVVLVGIFLVGDRLMNAAGFPILSLITWLPLVGGVIIMSVRGDEATVASNARWTALWTSLIVLVLSLVLWVKFDTGESGFQFVEEIPWLPEYGVGYKMGVDGISVLFVLLSTVLTPICILASWECIHALGAGVHVHLPRSSKR